MAAAEFALIDWIRREAGRKAVPAVRVGIGDDAAVLDWPAGRACLVTTDMLMEGVDFTADTATPELIGRKALAVNLSDIAAMGGRPVAAFVSVCLTQGRGEKFARRLYGGLFELAREFHVAIAGGDTNSWGGPLVINITVLGEPIAGAPLLRSGARPGDWICVTGWLGGSLAGRHLTFMPRVAEVAAILEHVRPTAMIDISDGLAADLHHILEASGVGARVEATRLPLSPEIGLLPADKSPLDRALSDGEDFELLFTVSPVDGERLLAGWSGATPLTRIGEITPGSGGGLVLEDGGETELEARGWAHPL